MRGEDGREQRTRLKRRKRLGRIKRGQDRNKKIDKGRGKETRGEVEER